MSKGKGWYSINKFLADSRGVSISTKVPVCTGGCCIGGSSKLKVGLIGESSESKVSRRSVIKVEIFRIEPSSPNSRDVSDGLFQYVFLKQFGFEMIQAILVQKTWQCGR